MSKEIENLKEQLMYHDDRYYNQDDPEISDEEYDALRERYKELTGEYHDKDFVPGEAIKNRVPHTTPMLSLDKAQITDEDDLRKRIKPLLPIIIEPKYDGLTIVRYPDKALTRGNGIVGEDVTPKFDMIPGLDIIKPARRPIRMEVVMTHDEFERINKERAEKNLKLYQNCRNAAAGMLRNDDTSKIQGLTAYIYEEIGNTKRHSSMLEDLKKTYGDLITPYWRFDTVDKAIEFIKNFNRDELNFDIDGLVIKSDQPNSLLKFGVTKHHPKNAFAIKFEAKGAWTEIIDVVWQVGRENITPVAILNPVWIDGSEISRCTLHNYSQMEALGLTSIDCDKYHKTLVYVIKANDVIPKITKIKRWIDEDWLQEKFNGDVEKIEQHKKFPNCYATLLIPPSACPECLEPTEFTDSGIVKCNNPECRGKLLNRILHMSKRDALDIVGLSEETAKKIMDKYPSISHPVHIFELTKDNIKELPGFAERSAQKLYDSIQASSTAYIDRVIYAAGMPLIGDTVSRDICNTYTIEEIADIAATLDKDKLIAIPGIGKEIAESFVSNWHMVVPFGDYMTINPVPVKEIKQVDKQLSICVTGSFEGVNREYFKDIIEEAGHKFAKSVSKKTDYLLAGEKAGTKLTKAKELNIPVLTTEQELRDVL